LIKNATPSTPPLPMAGGKIRELRKAEPSVGRTTTYIANKYA
jgi:hypothetical protein